MSETEQCEVLEYRQPPEIRLHSTELDAFFEMCADCAAEKTDEYPDLEEAEQDA